MHDFVPHCRLSLAYAYLLTGRFADAERETAVAQQTFQQNNNIFGLGQCHYTQASALRRQTHFQEATHSFTTAQALFQTAGASIQVAMTTLQLGLIQWWSQHDAPAAEAQIQQAANQFTAADLPLWSAQCQFGLSQIYQQTGRLTAATTAMYAARETFAQFKLKGLWADSSLESGWLAFFCGQYQTSLDYFQQTQTLYTEIGARWQQALILMHQGEVYVQMGLYQRALQHLEEAHIRWQELAFPKRLAACETRLSRVYLHLNNYARAHFYLGQADIHNQQPSATEVFPLIHLLRAEILFQEGKLDEAISFLHTALTTAQSQGNQVQAGQAERLLGQTLCESGAFDEGRVYLETAVSHFSEIGMIMEHAACQVNLGKCYAQKEDAVSARSAWQSALALTQGIAPELEWQVYTGLAQLAVTEGEPSLALIHYRHAITALGKMRRALWQPAVAGSFLSRPHLLLDQAVQLAVTQGTAEDALTFIEACKAKTTIHQMTQSDPARPTLPAELVELMSEIRWLQHKMSKNSAISPFGPAQENYQRLIEKVKQYDAAISRLERANRRTSTSIRTTRAFNLSQFRERATANLGENWLALDYYQSDKHIHCVVITATHYYSWQTPLTASIKLALKLCLHTGQELE
jgi:tetratricopeptide (TPR) repeat protein